MSLRLATLFLLVSLVASCGQQGPLRLPEPDTSALARS
ncbi:MAG: lipoprotein [Pseudomonadota bacterium]